MKLKVVNQILICEINNKVLFFYWKSEIMFFITFYALFMIDE